MRIQIHNSRVIIPLLFTLIYGIWCVTLDYNNIPSGYYITILLPITFVFVFCTSLWKPFFFNRTPFIITYSWVQGFRFIVLSIVTLESFQNGKDDLLFGLNSYNNGLLTEAGILMIVELLFTATVIYFSSKKNRRLAEKKELIISYNSSIYFLCFLIAISLILISPQIRTGLTFLMGYDSEGDIDSLSTELLLAREFFVTSKYFLLFLVIKVFFKRVELGETKGKKNDFFPLIIILFVCLIVVGLRIGVNRKRIIADAVACIIVVITLFPNYKRPVFTFFGVLSLLLVVSTTVFRGATQSLQTFGADLFAPASLQSYLCGQYNISCALETAERFGKDINLITFLYSSFRSFFGIGSFLSQIDVPTLSYYYNQVSSFGYTYLRESQIIPMIGEGAIYFTPIFAPLLSMLFVYLGVVVDRIYQRTNRLEYRFISVVIAVYIGQALSLSSNIIINNVTFKLALFMPVVIIANLLNSRNHEVEDNTHEQDKKATE